MDGYRMQADSYRILLEREKNNYNEETVKSIKNKIRILDILADFDADDKYVAFDSGIFNDIFRGYVNILVNSCIKDEKLRDEVNTAAYYILDNTTAQEAEEYLNKGFQE